MRLIVRFLIMLLMVVCGRTSMSQTFYLSTDKGKMCKLEVKKEAINDNVFDVLISVSWMSEQDLKPVSDVQSVVGFERDRISVNYPQFLRLVSQTGSKVITANSTVKLSFEVSEMFQGGDFRIQIPFFYAASPEAARDSKQREDFTFRRPKDFAFVVTVHKTDLVDKLPPTLIVVSPEGINEGLKPILETDVLNVKVIARDASGIESVTINNVNAKRENDSVFFANVFLKVGYENYIVALATDKNGKTTKTQFPVECRQAKTSNGVGVTSTTSVKVAMVSDVDVDIPRIGTLDPNRFALIIGNEDYSSSQTGLQVESNVDFAIHDAEVFKEYALKVFGVPEENIIFRKDAKVMDMQRALNQINSIAKNSKGKAEIYVFYAGHGFPDEQTKEPYLIPVDVSGNDLQFAIKLSDFYKRLTEFPTKRVTVFLDACFSGGGRNLSLISARGVKVKPKETPLKGNMVVFAASSGEQSSLPYREKFHGMFTYYLLKKIKETNGDLNLNELSDFLSSEIGIRSVIVNNKEQNPQTIISPAISESWKEMKIK